MPVLSVPTLRRLGIVFLTLQSAGGIGWWLLLWTHPPSRVAFRAPGTSDAALFAFFVPDLIFYIGLGLGCAYGLARRAAWAWPLLCVHAGAAAYAALYTLTLPLFSHANVLGAILMAPSLFVPPYLAWRLRPHLEKEPD